MTKISKEVDMVSFENFPYLCYFLRGKLGRSLQFIVELEPFGVLLFFLLYL